MGGFSPKLELRQGQSLVMTPQLQQAIKLLQFSNVELSAFVEDELTRNPLLERDERESSERQFTDTPEEDSRAAEPDPARGDGIESMDSTLRSDSMDVGRKEEAMDADFDNRFDDTGADAPSVAAGDAIRDLGASGNLGSASGSGGSGSFDDGAYSLENILTAEPTLHEHLTEQLNLASADQETKLIAGALIDMADEDGYVRGDLVELAEQFGAPLEQVLSVLTLCQTFEPVGIMARDLKECMALQLIDRDRYDPAMQALIENLELLAIREVEKLKTLCGVDGEDMADMIAELRALNPRPGSVFDTGDATPIIPDVFIVEDPEGGWRVELNAETLPRVLVNNHYHARVVGKAKNKDEKNFLTECLNDANWLVKSLDQRARTIVKVASEIVRQQDAFFVKGIAHLKPLNLRAIADAIEMHESTVSRVTANKYMATPRGLLEMKFFFTSAIQSTDGGDAHSAEAVRHRIRDLIDAENPKKILSDDKLVELLKGEGIDIARRTVAKYREAMHIPSSVQRRREKKMALGI